MEAWWTVVWSNLIEVDDWWSVVTNYNSRNIKINYDDKNKNKNKNYNKNNNNNNACHEEIKIGNTGYKEKSKD